jgi:hypothetical protein
MDCFPGWDEYFQHPASPSMPPGGLVPEEESKNKSANPYDSEALTSIQCTTPASVSLYGSALHLISHALLC